jgi:hypothetical protein
MFVFENRASDILYNFLKTNDFRKRFILTVNICWVLPLTFLKAGILFEFVDISSGDFCLDTTETMKRLNASPERYSGVLYVITYGRMSQSRVFFESIKR